jgi:hypothetical protein
MSSNKTQEMNAIKLLFRFFIWFIFLFASFGMTLMGEPYKKKDDLQASYERFWTNYTIALKQIKGEKNNPKAAQLVEQMKKDILPVLEELVKSTAVWEKNHTAVEAKKMDDWVSSNPRAIEVENLQSELMLRASKEGGALGKAYSGYMRGMMTAAREK